MKLEKLQLIATAIAAPHFKVRWLEFWNSRVYSRQAVLFPAKGFTDKDLESWLNKASFWAGISIWIPLGTFTFIINHDCLSNLSST
jgi:hypothetical protein